MLPENREHRSLRYVDTPDAAYAELVYRAQKFAEIENLAVGFASIRTDCQAGSAGLGCSGLPMPPVDPTSPQQSGFWPAFSSLALSLRSHMRECIASGVFSLVMCGTAVGVYRAVDGILVAQVFLWAAVVVAIAVGLALVMAVFTGFIPSSSE